MGPPGRRANSPVLPCAAPVPKSGPPTSKYAALVHGALLRDTHSMRIRLRWIAAQIGRKTGSQTAFELLPTAADLPGAGWKQVDQRTWRTGTTDAAWATRAREAGSLTAWRSFASPDNSTWLWIQVVPLASSSDAHDAMLDSFDHQLANLRSRYSLLGDHEVAGPPIDGTDELLMHELVTNAPAPGDISRLVATRVDDHLVVGSLSGDHVRSTWPTQLVAPIALVATRIRSRP